MSMQFVPIWLWIVVTSKEHYVICQTNDAAEIPDLVNQSEEWSVTPNYAGLVQFHVILPNT